jgi:hypothetical protein
VRVQEMGGGDSKEMSRERDFSEDWIRKLLKIAFFKSSTVVDPTISLRIFCDGGTGHSWKQPNVI